MVENDKKKNGTEGIGLVRPTPGPGSLNVKKYI